MKTLKPGEDPDKHYVAVVQIKEVTPAYRTSAAGIPGAVVVERTVEDVFTSSVRGMSVELAARRAVGQLEAMIAEGDEE